MQDLIALIEFFPKCLEEACTSRPVVLVIDSLDQLSAEDGGTRLDWLPSKLPDNAYLVLSTLPGLEYGCLPNLQVGTLIINFFSVSGIKSNTFVFVAGSSCIFSNVRA